MDADGSDLARFELGAQSSHALARWHVMYENAAGLAESSAGPYGPEVGGVTRPDPVHRPGWRPLTSSSGLTKLNGLLIGSVMMSPKVKVQLCVPAAGQVAASCQRHVT